MDNIGKVVVIGCAGTGGSAAKAEGITVVSAKKDTMSKHSMLNEKNLTL